MNYEKELYKINKILSLFASEDKMQSGKTVYDGESLFVNDHDDMVSITFIWNLVTVIMPKKAFNIVKKELNECVDLEEKEEI